MPASPPPDATQHYTLADIDAAIATFVDPLTPDEVVALAQWWTLRHFLADYANLLKYEDLDLLIKCGYKRDGIYVARLKTELKQDFDSLVELYKILPTRDESLIETIYAKLEHQPSVATTHLIKFIDTELKARRFDLVAHLIRSLDTFRTDLAGHLLQKLIETDEWMLFDEWLYVLISDTTRENLAILCELTSDLRVKAADRANAMLQRIDSMFQILEGNKEVAGSTIEYHWSKIVIYVANLYIEFGRLRDSINLICDNDLHSRDYNTWRLHLRKNIVHCHDKDEIVQCLETLPEFMWESDVALPLIQRLVDLQCYDAARPYFDRLMEKADSWLFSSLLKIFSKIGLESEVRAFIKSHKQYLFDKPHHDTEQPDRDWYFFSTGLASIGYLDEAESVQDYLRDFGEANSIRYAIILFLAKHQNFDRLMQKVEAWVALIRPAHIEQPTWDYVLFETLLRASQQIRDYSPDQSWLWLEQAEINLNKSLSDRHESGWRMLADEFFQREETARALPYLAKCTQLDVIHDLRNYVRTCLAKNDVKNARAFLQLVLQARTAEYNTALHDAVRDINAVLASPFSMARADQRTQPLPLVRDFAEPSSQNLPECLNRFARMTTIPSTLQAAMLQACLDVIAQFAPAWADLLENSAFEGIPA